MSEERAVLKVLEDAYRHNRITRRQLITNAASVASGVALGEFLSRLGISASATTKSVFASPARTDIKFGVSVDPVSPGDPRLEAGLHGLSQAINHVNETLIIRDDRMQPAPGLAERWEQRDPTTLRLALRKGVKFHNGETFDGESVKYTVESILGPTSKSIWKSQIQAIREAIIVDPYTVDLRTGEPYRPIVRMLANIPIMPAKAGRELGDRIAINPIGTGPFKHVEYVPGDHWTVERNPQYWGTRPKIERMTWKYVKDDGARIAALLAGDVDAMNNVPPDQIARLRGSGTATVSSAVSSFIIYVGMRNDHTLLSDRRIRQALNYAIDKKAIVEKLLSGAAQVADSPLAPTIAYRSSVGSWPYDPDRAKAMLKEAGYDPQKAPSVLFGTAVGRYIKDREIGQAVSGYLEAVGFKHTFEAPDLGSYFAELRTKGKESKYDMFLLGYGPQSMEPDQLLSFAFQTEPFLNWSFYKNPQVDVLLKQGRETFDEATLKSIYRNLSRIIWFDAPWLWLYYQPEITAYNKALKGYGARADAYLYLANASW